MIRQGSSLCSTAISSVANSARDIPVRGDSLPRRAQTLSPSLSFPLPDSGRSVLEDGEKYSLSCLGPNGVALVCNSKGCRPLRELEKVRLLERQVSGRPVSTGRNEGHNSSGGFGRDCEAPPNPFDAYYCDLLLKIPGNPLVLSNYARYLYQVKADYHEAEEYYERAILAGQEDGETLAQYAKVIWDNYGDSDRACSYFKQALQASPDNSYVLAGYVSFMWDVDDNHKT